VPKCPMPWMSADVLNIYSLDIRSQCAQVYSVPFMLNIILLLLATVDKEASAFIRRHLCHVKSECQAKWVSLLRKVLRRNTIHATQTITSEMCTEVPGIFATNININNNGVSISDYEI
jgi:hypothetical protein